MANPPQEVGQPMTAPAETELERHARLIDAVRVLCTVIKWDEWHMLNAAIYPGLTTRQVKRLSEGIAFVCGQCTLPPS